MSDQSVSAKPVASRLPQHPVEHPFEFHGKSGEFFKIWIVNICLTVLTLGIYSAWAKVRTHQYFYGHTQLAGSSFEYTANPVTILKGRLLAIAVLIAFSLLTEFYPLTGIGFLLAFIVIFPWLICRALKFQAINSRYRNISFNFHGQYKHAFLNYLLYPFLSVFTLYLAYPLVVAIQKRWHVNQSSYGKTFFKSYLDTGSVYMIYIKALGILILAGILFTILGSVFGTVLGLTVDNFFLDIENNPFLPFYGLIFLPLYVTFYVAFIQTRLLNAVFNSSEISGFRFESKLKARTITWLIISNTFAILISAGLLIPWTHIRMARYRAASTHFIGSEDLAEFTRAEAEQQNAVGEELGEAMDLEFGI